MSELAQRLRKLGGPPISASQTGLAIEYGNRNAYIEAATELDRLTAEVAGLKADAEASRDMLDDARHQLDMLRYALDVAYEPHQSLQERTLAAVGALLADEERLREALRSAVSAMNLGHGAISMMQPCAAEECRADQAEWKDMAEKKLAEACVAARAALAAQEPTAQEQK